MSQKSSVSNVVARKPRSSKTACPLLTTDQKSQSLSVASARGVSSECHVSSVNRSFSLRTRSDTQVATESEINKDGDDRNPVKKSPSNLSFQSGEREHGLILSDSHLSPICGLSTCSEMIHPSVSEFHLDIEISDHATLQENTALRNWEIWMKRRKQEHSHLYEKTKRKPCSLLMNQSEDFRKIREEKTMLQNARIPTPDNSLSDTVMKSAKVQKYLPEVEFVVVPDAIKKEKHVLFEEETGARSQLTWERLSYRKQQAELFSNKMKIMKPHEIEAKNLIVIGTGLSSKRKDRVEMLKEEVDGCESEGEYFYEGPTAFRFILTKPEEDVIEEDSVARLIIDGVEISRRAAKETIFNEKTSCSLLFDTKPVGSLTEQVLYIENQGTIAITYHWQLQKPLHKRLHEPCFFFDKNPGIFLPGQKYPLKFFHHSNTAGIHKETWILKTQPALTCNDEDIGVILTAVSEPLYTMQDLLAIESYVEKCVEEFRVKRIANEILERSRQPIPPDIEYRSLFLEEELFEHHNPKHYYHSETVEQLKEIFSELCLGLQIWDLSLVTLQEFVRRQVAGKEQDKLMRRISQLAATLLRPRYETFKIKMNNHMVYNVFCKMANLIEDDSNYLKACLATKPLETSKATITNSQSESSDDELSKASVYEINPVNLIHYQQSFYIKVYHQLSEAVEQVAAIVESSKMFEHRGEIRLNVM